MLVIGRRGMSGGAYDQATLDRMYAENHPNGPPAPTSAADIAQSAVRSLTFDPIAVEGSKAPLIPSSWWPWIIGTVVLGAVWYFVEGRRKGGGASSDAPFDG